MAEKLHNIGSTRQWADDFSANYDATTEDWAASHTFGCALDSARSLIPKKGDSCTEPGFSFLKFTGCNVRNASGGIAEVTCNYKGNETTQSTGDDPETDIEVDLNWIGEMDIGYDISPIEEHPYFKDIDKTSDEYGYVTMLKQGAIKYSHTNAETDYYATADTSGEAISVFVTGKIAKLMKLIRSGRETYNDPKVIWRARKNGFAVPVGAYIKKIGTKVNPPGNPPSLGEGGYIFQGANVRQEGSLYSIALEFWGTINPLDPDLNI
jgi:hypothetical protein